MASNDVSAYKANIQQFIGNPAAIQRVAYAQLEALQNGQYDLVDPSNPFVFCMESASLMMSIAIDENRILNRKQYPSVAVTEDEIYLHMSDKDYVDRFAKPASANFYLLLGLDDINKAVVKADPSDPYAKLVIPRNTEFDIAGYPFTMQYPIEIRQMSHGGLQIVYDVSKATPLKTLDSNIVEWFSTQIDGSNFVVLKIPVDQIQISEQTAPLNNSSGFIKNISLTDYFYYCRAFISNSDGSWTEILTTHTDQVFNPNEPTLLLQVFSDYLKVELPTIYFSSGLVSNRTIRIDVYTTKGPVDLILSNYISNQFNAKWIDYENDDNGFYWAALKTFKTIGLYSTDTVVGGGLPTNVDTLRSQVINNATGAPDVPITDSQVATVLNNNGFSVVKNLDNITDRQFLATKELPTAQDALRGVTDITLLTNTATSSIGSAIRTLELIIDDIRNKNTVMDNGERITLLPSTLYQDISGVINFVSDEQVNLINAMTKETMIDYVNSNSFSYTPFHYVMDISSNSFDLRSYYLDKPSTIAKIFVEENSLSDIELSIGSYSIEKVDQGYRIRIVTKSNDNFKSFNTNYPNNVFIQASFIPKGETSKACLDGTIKDPELVYGTGQTVVPSGELLFEFLLKTTTETIVNNQTVVSGYDLDNEDYLYLTNFQMYDTSSRKLGIPLDVDIDFVTLVTNYPSLDHSPIDNILAHWIYDTTARALVREKIRLSLGTALNDLWANRRTLMSSEQYQKYTQDVPKVYTENVYEIDPDTGLKKMTIVSGQVHFNKLHSIGDPYLDGNSQPIIEHHIGDIVLDVDGNPVPINPRQVARQIDLCLFDGYYYFATEASNKAYKDQIPLIIVQWLTNEIYNINQRLLERTKLFFYPKTTFGTVKVVVNDGSVININSEHSFNVKVFVPSDVYNNPNLKLSISQTIIKTISTALARNVVSLTTIQFDAKTQLGSLIKGVEISGFGPNKDITTFTVIDDTVRGAIRKRLQLLSENTIAVQDDVNIEFIKHEL